PVKELDQEAQDKGNAAKNQGSDEGQVGNGIAVPLTIQTHTEAQQEVQTDSRHGKYRDDALLAAGAGHPGRWLLRVHHQASQGGRAPATAAQNRRTALERRRWDYPAVGSR